jgi:hypothetical protein
MLKPIYKEVNDKINWWYLSLNPNAIRLLEKNIDKINWWNLSSNPNAIPLLEKNIDKINWVYLSLNPNAIHLLAKLDYDKMKDQCQSFAEELSKYVFNAFRLQRLADFYEMDMEEYLELL